MFVSILVETKKATQVAEIITDFGNLQEPRRDVEIRRSGSRGVYLLFKADKISPFMDYTKSLPKRFDYIRHIEFSYDDGGFYDGAIHDGELVFDEGSFSVHFASSLVIL